MPDDLTDKQRRFVEEYCVDFNRTQAAIRAGYSERTAKEIGHENLTKPHIRAAVDARLDELSMSAAEATKRLTDWGRGDFSPFLTDDGGLDLTSEAARENIGLLRKVKIRERMIAGDEDAAIMERKTEVELHDAKDAVKEIAKIRGLHQDPADAGERTIRIILTREGARRGDD